jgi:branched-chain amino acid transport system ATP-binding protein
MTVLRAQGIAVRYGSFTALHDVTVEANAGEVVTILGANGAGKTSFARACSGLVPTSAGEVWLGDQEITNRRAHTIRRAGLLYLPEGRGILPGLTVDENLRMAVNLAPRRQRQEAISRAVELFPALAGRRSQRAGSLSGGEQQMLSLARAFALPPKVMIADELSLGLAPRVVDDVFESLRLAKDMGVTILLIEQFVHRALEISDRCVIFRRGQTAWAGAATAAAQRASTLYMRTDVAAHFDRSP